MAELRKTISTSAGATTSGMETKIAQNLHPLTVLVIVTVTEIARTEFAFAGRSGKEKTAPSPYRIRQSVRKDLKGSSVAAKARAQKEHANATPTITEMRARFPTVPQGKGRKFVAEEESAMERGRVTA